MSAAASAVHERPSSLTAARIPAGSPRGGPEVLGRRELRALAGRVETTVTRPAAVSAGQVGQCDVEALEPRAS